MKGGKSLKLHSILYGIAFVSGLLGYAGLGGFIEKGTGLAASVVLLGICAVSAVLGMHEDGTFRKKNRT